MSTVLGMIVTIAAAFGLDGRTPLDRAVYDRIKLGMTETEVNEAMGARGFDYWEPRRPYGNMGTFTRDADLKAGRCYGRTWYGRTYTIDVFFYPDKGAMRKQGEGAARDTPFQRTIKTWQAWLELQDKNRRAGDD